MILTGDCLEHLKAMANDSVDSVVTDPPYGLKFMGKKWDYDVPRVEIWREVLRVLKPGGHLLSFGGTRTYHRMVVNIEDAGFEIRDQIMWIYGSGFPKSHNIKEGEFKGWGTALKPANEPIVLARKPLEGTVANNVLKHGCGGLNIDASRISGSHRWPANVLFDSDAAEMLDEQSGYLHAPGTSGGGKTFGSKTDQLAVASQTPSYKDSGGASRFFYVAKASKRERGEGNNHVTVKPIKLMEYLIRLVTSPGGTVLDPFMGSGSTGVACKQLGFNFIGIELNPEYVEIAEKRIERCV